MTTSSSNTSNQRQRTEAQPPYDQSSATKPLVVEIPGKILSIDELITDNLQRAFEDSFGEFQSVPELAQPEGDRCPVSKDLTQPAVQHAGDETESKAPVNDLDSLWSDLIGDLDHDERNQVRDQVSMLIREERFLDALKVRQGEEFDSWTSSSRLPWKQLLELVPENSRALFLERFPRPPSQIAEVDLRTAAHVQAAAHDELRQLIGLLPRDVETRQIYWIEMIKHVQCELTRSYGVFESVLAFCWRAQANQGTFWQKVSTYDRIQTYSQGLREMIRILYRLHASLPKLPSLKPSAPVFSLLSTALTSASDLQKWIRSRREGSDSVIEAIKRNLIIDEWCVSAMNSASAGPVCQLCYLVCDDRSNHISTSWVLHDNIAMHTSCANLFVHCTNREPSCLRLASFVEQLGPDQHLIN